MPFCFRTLAAFLTAAAITGCTNVPYYLQSVRGQLDVWSRQQDIERMIEKPQTPEPLREKLRTVLAVREFASAELALPQNASYRSYANLERKYVVWNVFATPEFSLHPHKWCFMFAGCVNYRGYFDKDDADTFAADAASAGYDVFVGGVPAYSLLGYFPDPVLNTFINYPTPHLARLVFHELAHQVVYVRDDSVFNESFAVTVEQEGTRRWLDSFGTDHDRMVYDLITNRRNDFIELMMKYRARLQTLYTTRLPVAEMRARKAQAFADLKVDYARLKERWGGFAGYDHWFAHEPNNAMLASIGLYTKRVPAFQALLAREGGDLSRFYAAAKSLAKMDKPQRTAALDNLMPSTSAGQSFTSADGSSTAH